jgi:colicin import membrane protein
MNSSKDGTPKISWFWGIILSLSLHMIIFLLAIFWGFGPPKQVEETQSIEGRLVSSSELEQSLKEDAGHGKKEEEVKAPQPAKPEIPEEPKKAEVKEERPKRAELKEEEPPPVKEEKPKDTIALETKKKKQVAEIPKPTIQPRVPPREVKKPKEPNFEDVRNKVLEKMQKVQKEEEDKEKERQTVLSEIEKKKVLKDIEEKRVAETNFSDEERETGRGSGSLNKQSPGARAALAALFIRRVREEIKNNWGIPENIPRDGSLRTVVVFRIDEGGKVHDIRVEKSSGNPAFDDFCVKAIYRASPLTPPPSELLEEAKTEGVEVPFTNDRS